MKAGDKVRYSASFLVRIAYYEDARNWRGTVVEWDKEKDRALIHDPEAGDGGDDILIHHQNLIAANDP